MFSALCVAASFVLMIVVNVLANALPLGGLGTGAVSALYPNSFVPAGYAFSIWSLIYLLLAAFAVSRFFPSERARPETVRLNLLFCLSCFANAGWIFAWHFLLPLLSLGIMLVLLGLLIALYRTAVPVTRTIRDAWYARLPFRIYLGWISVATIANASAVVVALDRAWPGTSSGLWAGVLIGLATALAIGVHLSRCDYAYPLVVLWAIVGILVRHAGSADPLFLATIIAPLVLIPAVLVWSFLRRKRMSVS